jgi:hypothetical protein
LPLRRHILRRRYRCALEYEIFAASVHTKFQKVPVTQH